MATRCTPAKCGPFLERLINATAAQDTWNAFLASHTAATVRSISIQNLVCKDTASPCNDRLPDGSLARPDGTHYAPEAAPVVARAVIDRSLAVAGLPRAIPAPRRTTRRSVTSSATRQRPDGAGIADARGALFVELGNEDAGGPDSSSSTASGSSATHSAEPMQVSGSTIRHTDMMCLLRLDGDELSGRGREKLARLAQPRRRVE